jgi:hypothetical protein
MLDEHDVVVMWRKLFDGSKITNKTVASADKLLNELPPESPLRVRLDAELDDICGIWKLERKNSF